MRYILLLCFLSIWLNAVENNYELIIKKKFDSNLYGIVQDNDDQISAVGFINDYKTIDPKKKLNDPLNDAAFGTQMELVRTDKNAKITLDINAHLAPFNKAVSVIKTPQNDYYVGGYTLDGEFFIAKLNSLGRKIFLKEFGTKNYDKMNKLVALKDGGVLTIGSSMTTRDQSDPIYETGLGLNDIFISRFSRDGELLWSKKYGTQNDDVGYDAVEAFDGSIIVLGSTTEGMTKDAALMRINERGDQIWFKTYSLNKQLNPYALIALKDNSFLASIGSIEDNNKEQINLLKFDLQQNIIAHKTIHTFYPSALYDIKESSNGSIIGVGYVTDYEKSNTDALAMQFSASLQLVWQEHFGNDNYDTFHKVAVLRDGQYVAVGAKTLNNSEVTNMWIVKFNKNGNIAKIPTLTLYEYLCKVFKEEIDAKKITITKDLTISFIEKGINYKPLKSSLTFKQKAFLTRFWKKFLPAIEKYKKNIKALEINGHTSSEWITSSFSKRYLHNANLSNRRAFEVTRYIFNKNDYKTQKWLTEILKQSGYSYSKKIVEPNGTEDQESSRRVTFKIYI